MVEKRDLRHLLGTREKTVISSGLFDEAISEVDVNEDNEYPVYDEDESRIFEELKDAPTRPTTYSIYAPTRPTTYRSKDTTDTYKSLQFDRRSVTPGTLNMRIKEFHTKLGGSEAEITHLPRMKNHRDVEIDDENEPVRGGKVFVTTIPCVSCRKNVHLKNHTHVRCQMLNTLPMNKVKGYRDYEHI